MELRRSASVCSSKTVYNNTIGYPPVHPRSRHHHERAGHAASCGDPGQHGSSARSFPGPASSPSRGHPGSIDTCLTCQQGSRFARRDHRPATSSRLLGTAVLGLLPGVTVCVPPPLLLRAAATVAAVHCIVDIQNVHNIDKNAISGHWETHAEIAFLGNSFPVVRSLTAS